MNHDGASRRTTNRLCFWSPALRQDYKWMCVCESDFPNVHYCLLSVRPTVGVHCKALALTLPRSIQYVWRNAPCDLGQSQCSSELQPLCRLTMERVIVFNQHLPQALILCSGTSYSLCMFACSSAFDGLPGLILAMQSLSQLSNVSLGGASGRETPAGRKGWRKDLSVLRIRVGVCVCACMRFILFFWVVLCVALCLVPLRVG